METRTYTERSNARRAARAQGVDPGLVYETEDGFTFPVPAIGEDQEPSPASDRLNGTDGHHPEPATSLDIPPFLKLTPEQRKEAWRKNPPKAEATAAPREITMPKRAKPKKEKADKNATLLSMLKGKGSTVEDLTKALDWLPHTLRARISRLAKPKSKGGEGLKIERSRSDGVTTYRIAS